MGFNVLQKGSNCTEPCQSEGCNLDQQDTSMHPPPPSRQLFLQDGGLCRSVLHGQTLNGFTIAHMLLLKSPRPIALIIHIMTTGFTIAHMLLLKSPRPIALIIHIMTTLPKMNLLSLFSLRDIPVEFQKDWGMVILSINMATYAHLKMIT